MSFDKSKENDLDEKRSFATESVNKGNTAGLRVEGESVSKVNKDEHGIETEHASREASFTRRTVIKTAAWIIPVILAVQLPPGDVFVHASSNQSSSVEGGGSGGSGGSGGGGGSGGSGGFEGGDGFEGGGTYETGLNIFGTETTTFGTETTTFGTETTTQDTD